MMNNNTIFGNFKIGTDIELSLLIENLNKEQSIYFLVEATKYAFSKGAYNITESELISKSIRTLYLPESNPIQTETNEQ